MEMKKEVDKIYFVFLLQWIYYHNTSATSKDLYMYNVTLTPQNMTYDQAKDNEQCKMIGSYKNLINKQIDLTNIKSVSSNEKFWFADFWKYSTWVNFAECYDFATVINPIGKGLQLQPYIKNSTWQPWQVACLHHCNFSDFMVRNFTCYCVNGINNSDNFSTCKMTEGGNIFEKILDECTCRFQNINGLQVHNEDQHGECLTVTYRNNNSLPEFEVANCSQEYPYICRRSNSGMYIGIHSSVKNFTDASRQCLLRNSIFNYNDVHAALQSIGSDIHNIKINSKYWIGIHRKKYSWSGIKKNANTTNCLSARLHQTANNTVILKLKAMKNCNKKLRVMCIEDLVMSGQMKKAKTLYTSTKFSNTLSTIVTTHDMKNAVITMKPFPVNDMSFKENTGEEFPITTVAVSASASSVLVLTVIVSMFIFNKRKKHQNQAQNLEQKPLSDKEGSTVKERSSPLCVNNNTNYPVIYTEIKLPDNEDVYNVLHEQSTKDLQGQSDYDHITNVDYQSNDDYSHMTNDVNVKTPDQAFTDYDILKNISEDDYDVSVPSSQPKDTGFTDYDTMSSVKHLNDNDYEDSLQSNTSRRENNTTMSEYDSMASVQSLETGSYNLISVSPSKNVSLFGYDTMKSINLNRQIEKD